jgi:hypothetical protein
MFLRLLADGVSAEAPSEQRVQLSKGISVVCTAPATTSEAERECETIGEVILQASLIKRCKSRDACTCTRSLCLPPACDAFYTAAASTAEL